MMSYPPKGPDRDAGSPSGQPLPPPAPSGSTQATGLHGTFFQPHSSKNHSFLLSWLLAGCKAYMFTWVQGGCGCAEEQGSYGSEGPAFLWRALRETHFSLQPFI